MSLTLENNGSRDSRPPLRSALNLSNLEDISRINLSQGDATPTSSPASPTGSAGILLDPAKVESDARQYAAALPANSAFGQAFIVIGADVYRGYDDAGNAFVIAELPEKIGEKFLQMSPEKRGDVVGTDFEMKGGFAENIDGKIRLIVPMDEAHKNPDQWNNLVDRLADATGFPRDTLEKNRDEIKNNGGIILPPVDFAQKPATKGASTPQML